jgi:HEAT repeat protein
MPKRLSIKAKETLLEEFKAGHIPDNHQDLLQKFLADSNHFIVTGAAQVIGKFKYRELLPHLETAFNRLIHANHKADVGCMAKIAIVKALEQLNYDDKESIFYRGITFVQMEPTYGGTQDTAAELRALCAMNLTRMIHPEIYFLLTNLLMDPEPQARTGAVRSLNCLNSHESELLLRMKILAGEDHPNVLGECFTGLVQINPERSLQFIAGFLDSPDLMVVEEAALALGESRKLEAFELLQRFHEKSIRSEIKQILLLPIALTRCDKAVEFLIEVVEDEYEKIAAAAVEALGIYRSHNTYREKIAIAVEARNQQMIYEAFQRYFQGDLP